MTNKTSERLQELSSEIMNLWEKRTLDEVQAANLQETLALRDSLPVYLTQLVDALSTTIDRTDARIFADKINSTRIGKKHGGERAVALYYTMDQMILEYHILRQVICDVMEREAILTPFEREVIVCSIEQAVNDAATQFSDTLRDFQDQLSHTLAHDLRTPLTTVRTSAQLMAKKPDDEKGNQEKLSRIIQSADRIDRMIQELLDVSKNNASNRAQPEFKDCDLDWLLRDVAAELSISNDPFVIQTSGACVGYWNEDLLRRVVENLANNAIKYSEPQTPITLALSQTSEEAILEVHNIGNPIRQEDQSQIFENFRRGKSTQRETGWGLGLTFVKKIIEMHKGNVTLESELLKGTTFTIQIPKHPNIN